MPQVVLDLSRELILKPRFFESLHDGSHVLKNRTCWERICFVWQVYHLKENQNCHELGVREQRQKLKCEFVSIVHVIIVCARRLTAAAFPADIHDRVLVILPDEAYDLWLDHGVQKTDAVCDLLKPFNPAMMRRYEVSSRVNLAKNDDPACAVQA